MKKWVLVLLGLVLASSCAVPAPQEGEAVVQEPVAAVTAIEPAPSPTATARPAPTEPPPSPTPTAAPAEPTPTPTPTSAATPAPIVYVVQAGDTLAQIAARFGVSVEAVAAQNGLVDVDQIEVGQALTMPEGAVPPPAGTPVAPTAAADAAAPEAERAWPGICHPAPEGEGARVADLPIGETIELTGYLYVKVVARVVRERIVFSFCPAPYERYPSGLRTEWCTIHAWIPRDTAGSPNHVLAYGDTWPSVVILDVHGREIRGWSGLRDSRHVRVVGTVVQPYGSPTGLGGSHTIEVVEIELLEGP